jgi:alanine racemase
VRPTWAQVDLGAIRHNISELQRAVTPAGLCAVIKADAYGHGDVPVAEAALEAGVERLAVALVEEGVRLREAGIEAPILVLSEPPVGDAAEMLRWGLTPSVYSVEFLEALRAAATGTVDVHVKVDTGMHRVGAPPELLPDLLGALTPPLRLAAVWTHLAVADEDPDFTRIQVERFRQVLGPRSIPVHLANTAGGLLFPEARGSMVRAGLGVYGLHPCAETRSLVDLRPALSVVSRVAYVRRLPRGARPSYGRRRPLPAEATVVTVPIGYADGVPRRLSDTGGEVLIGGRRHPIAGTVTMDQIVVDVADLPVSCGDEVVLLGRQGDESISADEWADRVDTISYEIVCAIGPRVPRKYTP